MRAGLATTFGSSHVPGGLCLVRAGPGPLLLCSPCTAGDHANVVRDTSSVLAVHANDLKVRTREKERGLDVLIRVGLLRSMSRVVGVLGSWAAVPRAQALVGHLSPASASEQRPDGPTTD